MTEDRIYPLLPALPEEVLTPRAWALLRRGIRRSSVWPDRSDLSPPRRGTSTPYFHDYMLDVLQTYRRPASREICRTGLLSRGITSPAMLEAAVDFELTFGGCAWEVVSRGVEGTGTFLDRKSFSIMEHGEEEFEDAGIVYVYCGAYHYSTPVEFALNPQGCILAVGLKRPIPVASSLSILIEDEALRQERVADPAWRALRVQDVPDPDHLAELGFTAIPYASDAYVQWWEREGIRVRLSRPWGVGKEHAWEISAAAREEAQIPPGWQFWRRDDRSR